MFRILVCDDDKEIVEAIEIYLTQEGYEVSSSSLFYLFRSSCNHCIILHTVKSKFTHH